MIYYNGKIFTPEGYITGAFRTENGRFAEIMPGITSAAGSASSCSNDDSTDLGGAKVIPGLIDIHTHGNSGADFSDGDADGLRRMAEYYAKNGITGFLPTSMTLPYETLAAAFETAREVYDDRQANGARVLGIHMEGPFFSEKKKGAQNAGYLRDPDLEAFNRLHEGCGGLIKIVDVAPELEGAAEFTSDACRLCRVSAAHTDAGYEDACRVFDAGAAHVTHLYNAMPGIHHREPGPIGAASERDGVYAELICDGLHVHPSAVRMAFRLFPGRICLISDSLRCCGMPDGDYELGGQTVHLQDHIARLPDGTIAGSASNLMECLRNAISFGIDEEEAILAATLNPANAAGAGDVAGSIEAGKYADFLVCSEDLGLREVYVEGIRIR